MVTLRTIYSNMVNKGTATGDMVNLFDVVGHNHYITTMIAYIAGQMKDQHGLAAMQSKQALRFYSGVDVVVKGLHYNIDKVRCGFINQAGLDSNILTFHATMDGYITRTFSVCSVLWEDAILSADQQSLQEVVEYNLGEDADVDVYWSNIYDAMDDVQRESAVWWRDGETRMELMYYKPVKGQKEGILLVMAKPKYNKASDATYTSGAIKDAIIREHFRCRGSLAEDDLVEAYEYLRDDAYPRGLKSGDVEDIISPLKPIAPEGAINKRTIQIYADAICAVEDAFRKL